MKIYSLFFVSLFLLNLVSAQKAVVALPAMNVIYIGLDNPIEVAVEGKKTRELTISAEGCTVTNTASNQYVLKATNKGECLVNISYKLGDTMITETKEFRIRSVPKPESMYGDLESGSYPAQELVNQHSITAVLPNFVLKNINFTVVKYKLLYVPEKYETCEYDNDSNNLILLEVKKLIAFSKNKDKIIVDDIVAYGAGGIGKRMAPIVVTITNSFPKQFDVPDYYTYKKDKSKGINELQSHEIYACDGSYKINSGVLKAYKNFGKDTLKILEVKFKDNKLLSEKHYYPSGKLKAQYAFESSDSIGQATCYYENGKVKSDGTIIKKTKNIYEFYRCSKTSHYYPTNEIILLDSFLLHNYAPIGKWKGYYENGKLALDGQLALYYYGKIPLTYDDADFDFSESNNQKKLASIKESGRTPLGYFKPSFIGLLKIYDKNGNLISEKNYKN